MRLKAKLAAAITGLALALVLALSSIYISQLLRQRIEQSYHATDIAAHQLLFTTRKALEVGLAGEKINADDPVAVEAAVTAALQNSDALSALMNSVINYSPTAFDVAIVDRDGRGLVTAPDPTLEGKPIPRRPAYASLQNLSTIGLLKVVFGPPRVYNVALELDRNNRPFLNVQIGVRTTFLANALRPWLAAALIYTGLAILLALIAAAFVARLALSPLAAINKRLDALAEIEAGNAANPPRLPSEPQSSDAVVQAAHKIERIGQRMKNVEEVFSALKENLDQILSNLQDGMMLFTRDARAVVVSRSVERFLGAGRDRMLGASVNDIFDRETPLGRTVRDAFHGGLSIVQEEVQTETGRRVEVSLDFIADDRAGAHGPSLGALLTLHDLESVHEIESELEVSRRMAAIGRLTSGVGHEVKNPINAIVVHLELLRNKMPEGSDGIRHLDVIASEIRRLDRVVATLVDFSRPVDLQLEEQDLREVVRSVLALSSAEMRTRNVFVSNTMPEHAVMARIDADLMKQALLNVVLNGAQAMAAGGELSVRLDEEARMAVIAVEDHGQGIPDEIRERIFDLYFTTKPEGSGIGLAMTYRILQLHHGRLDVTSKPGQGSLFLLKIPAAAPTSGSTHGLARSGAHA